MSFSEFNCAFLEANAKARRAIIKERPVILVLGADDCIWMRLYNDKANPTPQTPELINYVIRKLELTNYHVIKSVCHSISGLFLKLIPSTNQSHLIQLIQKNKEIFQFEGVKYWRLLCDLLIPNSGGGDGDHSNCNEKEECKKIMDTVFYLALKHCASLYAAELHRVVQELKVQVGSHEDWNRILVIVTGPPSPRPGHSALQYFARLTGQPEVGEFYQPDPTEAQEKQNRRLFYVENVTVSNITDVDKVCDIVAQQMLERKHYDSIIDMSTDILAFDTQSYLRGVCKRGAGVPPLNPQRGETPPY
jgi:hypothetical protein